MPLDGMLTKRIPAQRPSAGDSVIKRMRRVRPLRKGKVRKGKPRQKAPSRRMEGITPLSALFALKGKMIAPEIHRKIKKFDSTHTQELKVLYKSLRLLKRYGLVVKTGTSYTRSKKGAKLVAAFGKMDG